MGRNSKVKKDLNSYHLIKENALYAV